MTNSTIRDMAQDYNIRIIEFNNPIGIESNRNLILLPVSKVYTVKDASFSELCLINSMVNR